MKHQGKLEGSKQSEREGIKSMYCRSIYSLTKLIKLHIRIML